ncbi:MAG: hypothetical protein A2Z72_08910 [Omnitrophica bacterium RBG_13_46_9]|nr:MAG: hypothetical protein A2Z72_08910 [Omnitrophica bacterium RBG_13_46_9]
MCFYWREIADAHARKILSLEEIGRIARNFKNLIYVSITGGEPTLREDVDEIVYRFYASSGTRFVNITTNGLLPERTEQIVRSILGKCPALNLKMNLSLDHLGDSHDAIRGVKGAFKNALKTFSMLNLVKRENNQLTISISTVLSSYNKAQIYQLIDYVRDVLKPDAHAIDLVRGDTREDDAKDVTIDEFEKVIEYLKTKKSGKKRLLQSAFDLMLEVHLETLKRKRMILPCVAGKKILTLTDDGYVIPCEILYQRHPAVDCVLGDIRTAAYNINTILRSPKNREVISFIKESKCHCTFGCATLWNIISNVSMYPNIIARTF